MHSLDAGGSPAEIRGGATSQLQGPCTVARLGLLNSAGGRCRLTTLLVNRKVPAETDSPFPMNFLFLGKIRSRAPYMAVVSKAKPST